MTHPLDLLFLGSGNAFAQGRYWNSFLLDGRFLFDPSPIALPHLKRQGVAVEAIDAVFISHFHADHWFGLPFLLLEYAELSPRSKELAIIGPPGVEERLRSLSALGYPHLPEKNLGAPAVYFELRDGIEGEVAGLRYRARAVDHSPQLDCFGFRVHLDGRALAYSGDSTLCDALVDLAQGADTFVVECSCWEDPCGPHLTPDGIRELRRRLGPAPPFVLTHLDAGERDIDVENTRLASDLLRVRL